MTIVELIYSGDCPHVEKARQHLTDALTRTKHAARWREWRLGSAQSPERIRGYGSPTILVNGQDVAGEQPTMAPACRVYVHGDGQMQGVPSVEMIAAALVAADQESDTATDGRGRSLKFATLPAIVTAFLPKVACPACWPLYAGVLSAMGLGYLLDRAYLLPLTVVFLVVAVGALAYRGGHRRGYGPAALGIIAAMLVLLSKFSFDTEPAMYTGIALLIGASVWNAWPPRRQATSCSTCADEKANLQ